MAFDEEDFGFGQFGAGSFTVHVAADGDDGRDLGKFVEDGDFADIAEVKNAVDAAQRGRNFGAKEAVRVGDDAEEHGDRISGASGV